MARSQGYCEILGCGAVAPPKRRTRETRTVPHGGRGARAGVDYRQAGIVVQRFIDQCTQLRVTKPRPPVRSRPSGRRILVASQTLTGVQRAGIHQRALRVQAAAADTGG